jgi:hypothetical protein
MYLEPERATPAHQRTREGSASGWQPKRAGYAHWHARVLSHLGLANVAEPAEGARGGYHFSGEAELNPS